MKHRAQAFAVVWLAWLTIAVGLVLLLSMRPAAVPACMEDKPPAMTWQEHWGASCR